MKTTHDCSSMASTLGNKSAAQGLSTVVDQRIQRVRNSDDRNEQGIMNCEICKVIQKLGLPKSAHELWFCTDKVMPRCRRRVAMVQRRNCRLRRVFA